MGLVILMEYTERYQAEQAKMLLEENNIITILQADDGGGTRPHLNISSPVRLLVKEEEYNEALNYIDNI